MHLENDIGAGWNQLGLPGIEHHGLFAGRESADVFVEQRRAGRRTELLLIGHERHAHRILAQPLGARAPDVHIGVMHYRAIARPYFEVLHPLVFGKAGGHDHISVFHRALRRNFHFHRHLHHQVRRGNVPAFPPLNRRGLILGIPFRRAGVRPRGQSVDVGLAQAAVVGEVAVSRIGEPGRHLAAQHRGPDRLRPGPRALISQQRHRADLARTMAGLAVLLQDRQDILIKGDAQVRHVGSHG